MRSYERKQKWLEQGRKAEQELRIYHTECKECIAKGKAQAQKEEMKFLKSINYRTTNNCDMVNKIIERLEYLNTKEAEAK